MARGRRGEGTEKWDEGGHVDRYRDNSNHY